MTSASIAGRSLSIFVATRFMTDRMAARMMAITTFVAGPAAPTSAQSGWRRLISLIVPENHRSKAVALHLGGVYEKTIPFRDGAADIFMYDLT